MVLRRNRPNFDTKSAREAVTGGLFLALVSWVLGLPFAVYLIVTGIKDRAFWSVLVGLFMVPILLFQGVMDIGMVLDGISTLVDRKHWISGAARTYAKVLQKKEDSYDASYDEGTVFTHELALAIEPFMAVDDANEQCVWASVSKQIYDKYATGDIAGVYYLPSSPLTFVIDGE